MNRIARNTLYLYGRQLFVVILSLYISRLVLQTLGIDDFGIFNVVGSVITMFNFLNAGMIQATQRFMSYEVGKGSRIRQREVFSTLLLIHAIIAIIVFMAVETIGFWFLHSQMNIPAGRLDTAVVVLHSSLITYIIGVMTTPFSSAIAAHEHFGIPALLGIVDAVLKLGGIVMIASQTGDRLFLYAVMLIAVSLIGTGVNITYCWRHFEEVSLRPRLIPRHFQRILNFASWQVVGNVGYMGRLSGVNIVINLMCGVAVNAARGVAVQATAQINGFASTFMAAIMPQITKRYARRDYDNMIGLVMKGSKYTFLLLYLLALPFCLRCHYVMKLWLGEVPLYAEEFVILLFIVVMIDILASPLGQAINATGDIKWFQTSMAVVILTDIPLTYLILSVTDRPYYAILSGVVISLMAWGVRIYFLKRRITTFSFIMYFREIVRGLLAAMVSLTVCLFLNRFVPEGLFGLSLIIVVTVLFNAFFFYLIAMNMEEKSIIREVIYAHIHIK